MESNKSEVDISNTNIQVLPDVYHESLEVFNAFGNSVETIPTSIFTTASRLRELYLDHNKITSVPREINNLRELMVLSLHDNLLEVLPDEIGELRNLLELRLDRNRLSSLPDSICLCKSLTLLHIDGNPLTALPASIGDLDQLKDLGIGHCPYISQLPSSLGKLSDLSIWIYSPSAIEGIPESVLYDPSTGAISGYIRGHFPTSSLLIENTPAISSDATTLSINSPAVKLEELGPIIINTDGTMSRIPNWDQLTAAEREKTLRLIAKRNEKRKEELLAKSSMDDE